MAQANVSDFFGGGSTLTPMGGAQAPHDPNDDPNPANPGGISNNELMRQQRAATIAQQARVSSLPYGTPTSQGGTAQQYQVQTSPSVDARNPGGSDVYAQAGYSNPAGGFIPTGAFGDTTLNAAGQRTGFATGGAGYSGPVNASTIDPTTGAVSQVAVPGSGQNTLQTQTPNGLAPGAVDGALGSGVQGGDAAAANALGSQVQGSQPTTNPATAPTAANMQALTPVVDSNLANTPYEQQALDLSKSLIDKIFGLPLQTSELADREMQNQLAISRGARGGPGSANVALNTALGQAPALSAQAAAQTIGEQQARAQSAGQAAGIFAGVANNTANNSVNIELSNQKAGVDVLGNLTTLTGQQLSFDSAKTAQLGALAQAYLQNQAQFAQMDTTKQIDAWDNMVKTYGIDKQYQAAIEGIAASRNISPIQALQIALGVAQGVGSAAVALTK